MLEDLKKAVYLANLDLPKFGLVTFTWGNVSGIDRNSRLVVIKPSGVSYEELTPEKMVVVDFDLNVIEGDLRPSSDTPTHIELYKRFEEIGGIVHTHSPMAVSWAAACKSIPNYNTTHSDYFFDEIKCARSLTEEEINGEYEKNTGKVIIETFDKFKLDILANPCVLCANHGPFAWGKTPTDAVHNSVVLEEVAKMAFNSLVIDKTIKPAPKYIANKHFLRKHGENAYYGQK